MKRVNVTVRDRNDSAVGSSSNLKDFITVSKAHLWWPYTQNEEYGYLYTLEVTPFCSKKLVLRQRWLRVFLVLFSFDQNLGPHQTIEYDSAITSVPSGDLGNH